MKTKYKNILWRKSNITPHLTGSRKIILFIPAIILLAFYIIFLVHHASATQSFSSTEDVSFTINPTVNLSISGDLSIASLAPGDYKDSNIITVDAGSNSIGGYVLYGTVGSTTNTTPNLVHNDSDSHTFTSISTATTTLDDFNDNEWGYSYSTDSGTTWINGDYDNYATGYNGLPLYTTTGIKLAETNNLAGTSSINFKIGAKAANTQIAGSYTNTINFTVVAKIAPSPPIIPTDLTNTTWRFNDTLDLTPIIPATGSRDYYIDFPMELTVANFMEYVGASEYGITTWSQAAPLIPDYLQAIDATDITSTIKITDENDNYLMINYTTLYTQQYTPNNLYYLHDGVSHLPVSTGEIAFVLDGEQYSFSFAEFIQYLFGGAWLSEPYFDGVWNYAFLRTITITGGTDATNPTLIQWLVDNATQL